MSATRDTSISGGERFEKQHLKEAGVARSQISAYSNSTPNAGVSIQKMRAAFPSDIQCYRIMPRLVGERVY